MRKRFSPKEREQIFLFTDSHCGYCGEKFESIKEMQVDHILPVVQQNLVDDINDIQNLMPSCRSCNHYKRTFGLEGFRERMLTLHTRVCSHYIGKVALKYRIVELKPFNGAFFFEKIKYKCDFCNRANFDKPGPHRCFGGFRKRGLVFTKIFIDNRKFKVANCDHQDK